MTRADILAVDLPMPTTHMGREQVGHRPAIVVQTEITNASLPTTMIVPLTSNLDALRFPHTFRVDPSPQNGLTKPSVLLVFQLRAIDKKRLGNRIGRLEQHYLQQLEAEMRLLLAL
jgi:mRNA interferase MazF